jgi:hypothetical protein
VIWGIDEAYRRAGGQANREGERKNLHQRQLRHSRDTHGLAAASENQVATLLPVSGNRGIGNVSGNRGVGRERKWESETMTSYSNSKGL